MNVLPMPGGACAERRQQPAANASASSSTCRHCVRVAALKDQVLAGIDKPTPDARTPAQQLAAIGEWVPGLVERMDSAFVDHLVPEPQLDGGRLREGALAAQAREG